MRARKRVVARLEQAGATSAETAIVLQPERRMERKAVDYLRRREIIVEAEPGAYFVQTDKAEAWRRSVRTRMAVAMALIAAAGAALLATRI